MHRFGIALGLMLVLTGCMGSAPSSPAGAPLTLGPAYHLVGERQVSASAPSDTRWSPDGSYLLLQGYTLATNSSAVFADGPIGVLDATTLAQTPVTAAGQNAIWSADSRAILFTQQDRPSGTRQLIRYELAAHQATTLGAAPGTLLEWFAEGSLLYQTDAGLFRAAFTPGAGTQPVGAALPFFGPAPIAAGVYYLLSPDHRAALVESRSNNERELALVQANGNRAKLLPGPTSIGDCCQWSPNSQHLAYYAVTPEPGLYLVDRMGSSLHLLAATAALGPGMLMSLSFAPDSQTIAFEWAAEGEGFPADNSVIMLVNIDGTQLAPLTQPLDVPHRAIQWSPTGRHISFQRANRSVWFADVER